MFSPKSFGSKGMVNVLGFDYIIQCAFSSKTNHFFICDQDWAYNFRDRFTPLQSVTKRVIRTPKKCDSPIYPDPCTTKRDLSIH